MAIDGQLRPQVGHHRVDEADVVRGPWRVRRVPRRALAQVDLRCERVVIPLRAPASAVEHAIAQSGREDGHQSGRVGLLAPARDPQELLARAAAAVEHEHDGCARPGDGRGGRHVDDEPPRVAVDLHHAAVDPDLVREADRAVGDARPRRERAGARVDAVGCLGVRACRQGGRGGQRQGREQCLAGQHDSPSGVRGERVTRLTQGPSRRLAACGRRGACRARRGPRGGARAARAGSDARRRRRLATGGACAAGRRPGAAAGAAWCCSPLAGARSARV